MNFDFDNIPFQFANEDVSNFNFDSLPNYDNFQLNNPQTNIDTNLIEQHKPNLKTPKSYIYQDGQKWTIRKGKGYYGKYNTIEDAIKARDRLIENGTIQLGRIAKKSKIQKKQQKNQLNISSKQIQNPVKLLYLQPQPQPQPETELEQELNIETQMQIYNYIQKLEQYKLEMNKSENQIKVNMKKIISSTIKQNDLVSKLDDLNKKQETLLDFVNIITSHK